MSEPKAKILLVDDEPNFLISMGVILQKGGIEPVRTMEDSREVLPYLEKHGAAVVVLDLTMPHISGGELLKKIRTAHPGVNVIILTGHDDLEMAVECMRVGAFDYLVKPVEQSRFLASIGKALELRELQQELSTLKEKMLTERPAHMEAFSSMITVSQKMMALFKYAEAVAVSDQPVLITGETGVGKELMAQAVHDLSGRPGNFIAVTVAGLDDHMFSDTLFGHEKGAYTGAERVREGLIRKAEKGTLFLDEIGDLIESSQVKLLRLLQEKQYYPLGSDTPRRSAAPVVVATNRNLVELQEKYRPIFAELNSDYGVTFEMCEVGMSDRNQDTLNDIADKALPEIMAAAIKGTNDALHEDGRPTTDIILPTINTHVLGQLFQMLMIATVIEGRLLGINPNGQPGVEQYKKNMNINLGRA